MLLSQVTRRRPEFATGFLFAVALLSPLMPWFATFHPLAPFAVILLSAVPYGVASRWATSPFWFAATFTGAEFFRSVGIFALPWGVVGSLAAETPWRGLAAWGGTFGLSFLFYMASALLARHPIRGVALLLVALACAVIALPPAQPKASEEARRYGLVQGNFTMDADYEFRPAAVWASLEEHSRHLVAHGARLIAWSETVILEYLNLPGVPRDRLQQMADRSGSTFLVGAPTLVSSADKRNSAYLFVPNTFVPRAGAVPKSDVAEEALRYDKVHLVPFGEFLPGYGPDSRHRFLPEGTGDFTPALFPTPIRGIGPLICYEGALPWIARLHVLFGARLLVNLSNDAWTKSPAQAAQHYALMKLRAVETGRPLVRVGNVGVSGIVAADGTELALLNANQAGILSANIALPSGFTPYVRWGDWPGWLCLLGVPFLLTVQTRLVDHR